MGSDWGEFWRRILRFSWFGHQSLFDLIPTFVVPCMTGHFASVANVFLLTIELIQNLPEARRGAHFTQSPRKMSSHSRRTRLPREPEAGLGTSYHSISSTLPHRSQMKW